MGQSEGSAGAAGGSVAAACRPRPDPCVMDVVVQKELRHRMYQQEP